MQNRSRSLLAYFCIFHYYFYSFDILFNFCFSLHLMWSVLRTLDKVDFIASWPAKQHTLTQYFWWFEHFHRVQHLHIYDKQLIYFWQIIFSPHSMNILTNFPIVPVLKVTDEWKIITGRVASIFVLEVTVFLGWILLLLYFFLLHHNNNNKWFMRWFI